MSGVLLTDIAASSNRSSRSTAAVRSSRWEAKAKFFGARDRRRYLHWLFEAKKREATQHRSQPL
jgi:hypothetical protein